MNNKAQIGPIVSFVVVTIILLMSAPIIYKVINTPLQKFATAINQTDQNAGKQVDFGRNRFFNLFDYIILFGFFTSVIALFVSSFLIDIHPAFVVVYIVGLFILFLFSPTLTGLLDRFYDPTGPFGTEISNMPGSNFLYVNYNWILLGICFITGILIFGKLNRGGSGQSYGY